MLEMLKRQLRAELKMQGIAQSLSGAAAVVVASITRVVKVNIDLAGNLVSKPRSSPRKRSGKDTLSHHTTMLRSSMQDMRRLPCKRRRKLPAKTAQVVRVVVSHQVQDQRMFQVAAPRPPH